MEAKELRIGNKVQSNGHIFNVTVNLMLSPENFNPIPLTEEWILKFRFENWGEVTVNEHEKYKRFVLPNAIDGTSNFEVHIIKSNYSNMPHTEIVYSIDNDERQIIHNTEFVHNLQNSFYLSSGTELTINE